MEEYKNKLTAYVCAQLLAAPESAAKVELVEELSDNLYRRWLDMTAAGMSQEDAYVQAADELGDVEELVDYLKGLGPDEPLPGQAADEEKDSQLDDLLKNVEEIAKGAIAKAKSALRGVKERLNESGEFHWKSEDGTMEFHMDGHDDDHGEHPRGEDGFEAMEKELEALDAEFEAAEREFDAAKKRMGMNFSIELDTGKGEFKMGGEPSPKDPEKDIVYGVGYDKNKGGFYAQWGEYKGSYSHPVDGPVASEALKGIEVQTVNGDVTIRMTENPDGDVIIDGDVDELDVRRSDDGVLTIGQGKTASASFFFGRGLSSADVVLYLPRRTWEFLKIATVSGDIHIDGDCPVGAVAVKTTSGDLEGGLPRCDRMDFRAISGDLIWKGDVSHLRANTTSGDVSVNGFLGEVETGSVSGDIRLEGAVTALRSVSSSGDITVRTAALPEGMELRSSSGDCVVSIPDRGPFVVQYRTGSGSFRSDFFPSVASRENALTYGEGGPTYHLTSSSGDLRLKKF